MKQCHTITIDCRMFGKEYGGIGRYTLEIISRLPSLLICKYYILSKKENIQIINDLFKGYNYEIIECNAKILSFREQLYLIYKIPKCDLLWSPYMNVPFLPCKAKHRVVTIHDVFHLANPEYYGMIVKIAISLYYKISVYKSKAILTVSEFSKKEIQKYFNVKPDKIFAIYNGCDIDKDNIKVRPFSFKYVLFVGSIKPHKNLRNALNGYKEMLHHNYKFVIVGRKDGFITGDSKIFNLISEINGKDERIIFTGNISDKELYEYYKSASVLIQPSFYEGFGLPIVEAMAFNLPIVCSDIPIFKEIGKDSLIYFDPHSPSDIASKLDFAIDTGTVFYKTWYSWDDTAKKIADVLSKFLN